MSNKIQVVNEKDELIDHKERSEVNYATDIYRSTCLWIENSKGEVLIAQRKMTKDKDPGKWGPAVAGTVDEGETYESNIIKEAEEEIGLLGYKPALVKKIKEDKPRHHFISVYYAKVNQALNDFNLQEDEVEQLRWIDLTELELDIKKNPEKYVSSMGELIEVIKNA